MLEEKTVPKRGPDVIGLVLAGAVDLAALAVAGLVLAPGSRTDDRDAVRRSAWIAAHQGEWKTAWIFWFVVTTTFAWSFYGLARHLSGPCQWRDLAVGLALLGAAVDLVGIVVNLAVLPQLATRAQRETDLGSGAESSTFRAFESLAHALTNVTSYGLYTAAGLLLIPATFSTSAYPRAIAWVGVIEWGISAIATLLLAIDAELAAAPFSVAAMLFALWIWGSARWLWQTERPVLAHATPLGG